MNIESNIRALSRVIPPNVKLVAVSKTRTPEEMMEAYEAGQRAFGENRVREIVSKYQVMPADTEWHFIGHLQTNKVKQIASFIRLIHSIDSLHLLTEVNQEAAKCNRVIDCLLQFYIATEETKFGLDLQEAKDLLESQEFRSFANIRIAGVMGMATLTDDKEKIRQEFRTLKGYFELLRQQYFFGQSSFREISMGMSGDYPIAIEEGSTMIRIGTRIFEHGK